MIRYLTFLYLIFTFQGIVSAQCPIQEIDILGLDFPGITCFGDNNIQLQVDFVGPSCPNATYNWSNGLPPNQTVSLGTVTLTTTYFVTVTDNNGNTSTSSATVVVNNQLTIGVSANPMTICSGQSSTLLAQALGGNGTYSYNWNNSLGSGPNKVVNPLTTTTYTVTVTDGVGCTATGSIQVSVNQSPTVAIDVSNTSICQGETVTLSSSGGSICQWNTQPPQNNCSISVMPPSSTNYMVTVTSGNGCTGTSSIQITVLPPPTANAGADLLVCDGTPATLTASGGTSYSWSTGQNNPTIIVNPSITTCYTVTAFVGNCSDKDTVCVGVKPSPTANAGPDVEICPGEEVTLEASGGTTYAWSTGATTKDILVIPLVTTVYRVTVTNSDQCMDIDDVTVTVKPGPNATISNGGTVCDGGSVTLTATGGESYFWNTGATSSTIIANPDQTTLYSVTVTGPQECDAIVQTTVTVVPDPSVGISGAGVKCTGGKDTLSALAIGGAGPVSYQWEASFNQNTWSNTGNNTASLILSNLTQTTHYRVRVNYNTSGCDEALSEVATVSVVTEPHPIISSFTTTHCENEQTLFYIENPSSLESIFEWDYSNSSLVESVVDMGGSILIHFGDTGSFILSVTEYIDETDLTCQGDTSIEITVNAGNSAPDTANIIITSINNILIYNDSTVSCYQWGEINENGVPEYYAGENYQAYVAGSNYSPATQYFVQVWNGDCDIPECSTIKLVPRSIFVTEEPVFKSGLYPNPNFGEFTFEMYPVKEIPYILQVSNPLGMIIEQREVFASSGEIREVFSIPDHRDGIYYLSVWSADQVYWAAPFLKISR